MRKDNVCGRSLAVTSTVPVGFMVLWVFVCLGAPRVVLVLKRLRRRGHGFK